MGKGYYYKVIAIGANSKSAYSAYKKLTAKCAQPVITVEATDDGNPVIKWSKVSGAKKYTVYRTNEYGREECLGTTTALTFSDYSTTPSTTYAYRVCAIGSKSAFNSIHSEPVSWTTGEADAESMPPEGTCSYCGGLHYLYECAKAKEDAATKPTEARKCNLCGSTTCPSLSNKGSKKDCPAYDEKKDPSKYCLYCGKAVSKCKRWLKDKKCPNCGAEVPANTCHYC